MSDNAASRSDGFVDQLLLEAGLDDDGQLRPALLELRAFAGPAPEPSAEVAALMAGTASAGAAPAGTASAGAGQAAALDEVPPVDELAARRRTRRRVALTTLSVAISLGAGGAVAAASDQGFRDSFTHINQAITSFVTGAGAAPAGDEAVEPARPAEVPAAPATDPAMPAPTLAAERPAVPAPSGPTAADGAPGQAAVPDKPAADPSKTLPSAVPGDITEGMGRPTVPVPEPSDLPLPESLPAVPLR